MNTGKDYKKERADLFAKLEHCVDDEESLELNRQIVQLNREEKEEKETRADNVSKLFSDLKNYHVDFEELMASRVYAPQILVEYLEQHNLIPSSSTSFTVTQGSSKQDEKEAKKPLIVGTFQLADYGFEMPKNTKGQPLSNETQFVWDWNKRYGGLGWENKFIKVLAEKGYEHVLAHAADEFKGWLTEYREGEKRAKGKKIFENKREFLNTFGIKPAEADNIELNFNLPDETFTRMADEHSQSHPQEHQEQGSKRKGKKATA